MKYLVTGDNRGYVTIWSNNEIMETKNCHEGPVTVILENKGLIYTGG